MRVSLSACSILLIPHAANPSGNVPASQKSASHPAPLTGGAAWSITSRRNLSEATQSPLGVTPPAHRLCNKLILIIKISQDISPAALSLRHKTYELHR